MQNRVTMTFDPGASMKNRFDFKDTDLLSPAKSMYRGTRHNVLSFYNDGSNDEKGEAGAFADMAAAIEEAEEFIFITGWSFHPNFYLQRKFGAKSIGRMLLEKADANPDMLIAVMPWFHITKREDKMPETGDEFNNFGDEVFHDIWKNDIPNSRKSKGSQTRFPANLLWRASPYHVLNTCSHHQKYLVCDAPSKSSDPQSPRIIRAFFGGLDITKGRFDWSKHVFLPSSKEAKGFLKYSDWYSAEFGHDMKDGETVRQPWHDIHAQIIGPGAWDFVREFTARWCAPNQYKKYYAFNPQGHSGSEHVAQVYYKYQSLLEGTDSKGSKIVRATDKQPALKSKDGKVVRRIWKSQFLHSINKVGWGPPKKSDLRHGKLKGEADALDSLQWKYRGEFGRSIQDAYLKIIQNAKDFIYIESQYLIGSGARWGKTSYGTRDSVENKVAETIVKRIKEAVRDKSSFHVYVVLPMFPEGPPDHTALSPVRFLQWTTIEYMVRELFGVCGPGWRNYLSFCCLANWETSNALRSGKEVNRRKRVLASKRYMIYVHSKMMIVDDQVAIIGSANLNERSLNGNRDTECAVVLWPDVGKSKAASAQLSEFRKELWTEHMGRSWMSEFGNLNPGSKRCIENFGIATFQNYYRFLAGVREPDDGNMIQWPIEVDESKFGFSSEFIPDYSNKDAQQSRWLSSSNWLSTVTNVPE